MLFDRVLLVQYVRPLCSSNSMPCSFGSMPWSRCVVWSSMLRGGGCFVIGNFCVRVLRPAWLCFLQRIGGHGGGVGACLS